MSIKRFKIYFVALILHVMGQSQSASHYPWCYSFTTLCSQLKECGTCITIERIYGPESKSSEGSTRWGCLFAALASSGREACPSVSMPRLLWSWRRWIFRNFLSSHPWDDPHYVTYPWGSSLNGSDLRGGFDEGTAFFLQLICTSLKGLEDLSIRILAGLIDNLLAKV